MLLCNSSYIEVVADTVISHGVLLLMSTLSVQDGSESRSRARYHENSLQHRVKNRVWQTLLVLFPRFDQVG